MRRGLSSRIAKGTSSLRYLGLFLGLLGSCGTPMNEKELGMSKEYFLEFDQEKAQYLYRFAYDCIEQEYPNKLGQVLGDSSYLASPKALHPAFYGCFDWHSSVHGHWALVKILSLFPNFPQASEILVKLKRNIQREKIAQEILFFQDEYNQNFERTYGWAWLLKLDAALREWDHPEAPEMQKALAPLSELMVEKYLVFLDKLDYPIRVGEHPNTAFGLSFAYDYAQKYHAALATKIEEKARAYYLKDENCPVDWEPGGFDFLSPCLQEAALMKKVLPKAEFTNWLKAFLPGLLNEADELLLPAKVSDRSDGKLAHLDGLNFSRAWCLYEIAEGLNAPDLEALAQKHFNYSFEKMDSGEYAGSHWLASFAIHALMKGQAPSKTKTIQ